MRLTIFVTCAVAVTAQYAASLLGNVALTTVSGIEDDGDFGRQTLPVGTNIFGPFEAGFSSRQDFVLAKLGCSTGRGYLQGGIDTWTAEQVVAKDCNVQLPRWEGNNYISLLGTCGGHTGDYHFHERFSCLYEQKGGHSTKVGAAFDGKAIYGKWENFETQELPLLDACGGHWGPTPDGGYSYHYHVQDTAPFTIGCYGPNPDNSLVTVEQCRKLYSGCGDGDNVQLDTSFGKVDYDPWCPCYDADGSNIGTKPLPVFEFPELVQGPGGDSVLEKPSALAGGGEGKNTFGGKMGGRKGKKGIFGGFRGQKYKIGKLSKFFGARGQKGGQKGGRMGKFMAKFANKFNQGTKVRPQNGFRVEQNDNNSQGSSSLVKITSQKFKDYCIDASSKKVKLRKCNQRATQKWVVVDDFLMFEDQCLSQTLTLGPCTAESLQVGGVRQNIYNLIVGSKCIRAKNKNNPKVKVGKCNGTQKNQRFVLVEV